MNKLICAAAAASAVLLGGPAAQAAGYPDKPVTMIVPFVPGGSSDITARSVTPALSKILGQTFVVENKPGANSAIGAQALARSTPDGYTMMVGSIGTFAINEALYKNLTYNPSRPHLPGRHRGRAGCVCEEESGQRVVCVVRHGFV
jgi:tripartite-type tricarboxylate transporter receptor subunit TctC